MLNITNSTTDLLSPSNLRGSFLVNIGSNTSASESGESLDGKDWAYVMSLLVPLVTIVKVYACAFRSMLTEDEEKSRVRSVSFVIKAFSSLIGAWHVSESFMDSVCNNCDQDSTSYMAAHWINILSIAVAFFCVIDSAEIFLSHKVYPNLTSDNAHKVLGKCFTCFKPSPLESVNEPLIDSQADSASSESADNSRISGQAMKL